MDSPMMKAAVYRNYGPPDVLKIEDVLRPSPKKGFILVKSCGSSVNMLDTRVRRGILRFVTGPVAPIRKIPGSDVAGEVVACGPGVTRFKTGDGVYAVVGIIGGGGFAEYVLVPEKAAAKRPRNISCEDAAAVPLVAQAALQALRDLGGIRRSTRILINGASGGVGTAAIQIAKFIGAKVIAVGPADSLDQMRTLGADRVIDYKREDFTADKNAYDIIFDVVTSSFWKCRGSLKPGGVYIASNPSSSLGAGNSRDVVKPEKGETPGDQPTRQGSGFHHRSYRVRRPASGHRPKVPPG